MEQKRYQCDAEASSNSTKRYWCNSDRKRYWYFVTDQDMGDGMTLRPRTPKHMADGEPLIKRICVAPTAAHCLSAVNVGHQVHVYRTKRRVMAMPAVHVPDSSITREHWLRRPTQFEKVYEFCTNAVWVWGDRGGRPESGYWQNQLKDKQRIKSFLRKKDKRLVNIKDSNERWTNIKTPSRLMASIIRT